MPELSISVSDYNIAGYFAGQIRVGSAFAFIGTEDEQAGLLKGLENFFGMPTAIRRRTLPLLPDEQVFPGFKVQLKAPARPFSAAPVVLADKEIYRSGKDSTRLLLVAPAWSLKDAGSDSNEGRTASLVLENNGAVLRKQSAALNESGLTLVNLGKLPEGNYRVYWDGPEAADYEGEKAECRFSVVEYVLAPLQATLLAHELDAGRLACRLKVERYNEPLNEPVQVELWSGTARLGQQKLKPSAPGIYRAEFKLKHGDERLELRVSYLDLLATAVIPGSRKVERDETVLSGLGQTVRASLMPRPGSREVRGLYLSKEDTITNSPVELDDPAPESRKAHLRCKAPFEAARLLLFDLSGAVVENRDLGQLDPGQELELEVPAPGGFLAMGGWITGKPWEGWAALLSPAKASLELTLPATARPGQAIKVAMRTMPKAAVYLLARDTRLASPRPQERLAAALKKGLEGSSKWGNQDYQTQPLNQHPDWPGGDDRYYRRAMYYDGTPPDGVFLAQMAVPAPMMPVATGAPPRMFMRAAASSQVYESAAFFDANEITGQGFPPPAPGQPAEAAPRQDFADIAFCGLLQADETGQASLELKLPDAITTYQVEAFALSRDGAEWAAAAEGLEVNQPVWAEFKLPAFIYPGDLSPAALEIRCADGAFRLRLLCDGLEVPYTLAGARQGAAGEFSGHQAHVTFEARPGRWQAEVADLASGEIDRSEREVQALGSFKSLARRFQVLTPGEVISRQASGALQLRLLPSLDRPFNLLCDATAGYGHRCCEQTAAKLLAAVAALVAGGDRAKLGEVILAGVARERRMYLPGRGFMMYPPEESGGGYEPNDYWGKLAAEHLSNLALYGPALYAPGGRPLEYEVRHALEVALNMGEDAAAGYRLPLVPTTIKSGRDAYQAVARKAPLRAEALRYARQSLTGSAHPERAQRGAVLNREEMAYCAAALLKGGDQSDLKPAIEAANALAKSLDESGRLYSTVDSSAMISLLAALQDAGVGTGQSGRVSLDGRELDYKAALELAGDGRVEEIRALEGVAIVEVTTEVVEEWSAFRPEVPVRVELQSKRKAVNRPLRLGDNLELVVAIRQYESGLLVHVCLPPALAKIEGGGEVKKFSVDFCGRTEVRIPLRASGHTRPGGERWAVLVRNMFKEEQAGNPGLLLAQVSAD